MTGRAAHVMVYEEGAVLEDTNWQAPEYCFQKGKKQQPEYRSIVSEIVDLKRASRVLRGL